MHVGDYVQVRKSGKRGEVMHIDADSIAVIYRGPEAEPLDEFFFEPVDNLITILRKESIGDV